MLKWITNGIVYIMLALIAFAVESCAVTQTVPVTVLLRAVHSMDVDAETGLDVPDSSFLGERHVLGVIEFESKNLSELSRKYGVEVSAHIYFCAGDNDIELEELRSTVYVYDNNGIISQGISRDDMLVKDIDSVVFKAYFYFESPQRESIYPNTPRLASYNLLKDQRKICFKIFGGSYRSHVLESNVVEISKEKVQEVVHAIGH